MIKTRTKSSRQEHCGMDGNKTAYGHSPHLAAIGVTIR
jgi:hypothetical protein